MTKIYNIFKGNILNKVTKILELARNGVPQALARFNDGECGIIFDKDFVAARGKQKGSIELQTALIDAIKYEQKNYWKGYPCPKCYPKLYRKCIDSGFYDSDYEFNTMAVVNTNRNLQTFSDELQDALKGKKVVWVSGFGQNLKDLNFDIKKHLTYPGKDSWRFYLEIERECLEVVRPKYVFLFSLGPVARVLVRNLFEMRPDASYLDIGDTYSPQTMNTYRKCHTGMLKECEGCN
jgi:hypothetical protein